MSSFEFSALGPEPLIRRGLRRLHGRATAPGVALWCGMAVVAAVYSTGRPGEFTITAANTGGSTTDRYLDVQGQVENPSIGSAELHVNGATQLVSVYAGQFAARVPLSRGENVIWASVAGVVANLSPGSNALRVNAALAPVDVWSALTWDGPGDIDLHLVLPDGSDCYYGQPSIGGATLDFDNRAADGPEHVVMEHAPPGKYQVRVVYFAPVGAPRSVRWSVDLRLRDERQRFHFSGVLDKVSEVQSVTTFSFP